METNTKNSEVADLSQNSTTIPEDQKQQEPLYFNVMPKNNQASGQIVEPTMQASDDTTPKTDGSRNFLSKYKLYVILTIIVLILAPVAYFFVPKFFANDYPEENLLVPHPTTTKSSVLPPPAPVTGTTEEWQLKKFGNAVCLPEKQSLCGDTADPDIDGLTNLEEFNLGTDPNNKDSDQDGLADGDEKNVFLSNPLKSHSLEGSKYSDLDFVKNGYAFATPSVKLTASQIDDVNVRIQKYNLHQPTVTSVGEALNTIYKFNPNPQATKSNTASTTPGSSLDQSTESKQDRDAQRSLTIKNIGIALVKYFDDNKTFPATTDFKEMYNEIKIYLKVASNPIDPINQDPFVYSYVLSAKADDFTLSFFSEVANQPIKKNYADALKDKTKADADIYDDQRKTNLESLRNALIVYSDKHVAGNQDYVFPPADKYKTELVPGYISAIPKDPKTKADYEYKVSDTFDTFTLKAILDNPPAGTTGYMCNQDDCSNY